MTSNSFASEALSRLPLAEAAFLMLDDIFQNNTLEAIYQSNRGRTYTRILTFSSFFQLLRDSLISPDHSARARLIDASEKGELPTSLKAFYDKLAHMPPEVGAGLLSHSCRAISKLLPRKMTSKLPKSLCKLTVVAVDGKVIKHTMRRLLPLRISKQNASKLLGGKALVAVNLSTGLVMEMASELDGEASETRLLAPLLQQLKDHCGEKLIVADRCYGFYKHIAMIKDDGCHFVLRVASITQFIQDPEKPARIGKDRYGRKLIEEHGWITSQKNTKLIAVRRLSIIRDKVQIQLLTDLTDSKRYPADDIAEIYRYRWDIERVYATITKVFQLRHLIGTSPEAGLIQASLCLILFNITEAIKWHISVGNGKKIDEVSGEMLWRDIRDEVMAATRLLRTRCADAASRDQTRSGDIRKTN
ncbi:MAG: IS4 family transposase [Zavarzinella sp.]